MAGQVAERKRVRREAARPKPAMTITKSFWDGLARDQKKQWRNGDNKHPPSRFVKMNRPGRSGPADWVCVHWKH